MTTGTIALIVVGLVLAVVGSYFSVKEQFRFTGRCRRRGDPR